MILRRTEGSLPLWGLMALWTLQANAAQPDFTGLWQSTTTANLIRTLDGAPPLLPAAQAELIRNQASFARHDMSFDPQARCIPPGVPRIFSEPEPFLIVQRPTQLLMLFQLQRTVRRIYVQGSETSAPDASRMGNSVAHWQSDQLLVIETSGFSQAGLLDNAGTPFSQQLHVTERLHLLDTATLENLVTIEDPASFSRAWQARYLLRRLSGTELQEDVCADRLHPERLRSAAAAGQRAGAP